MLIYAKDLTRNVCGQHLNNLEVHKKLNQYSYKLSLCPYSLFSANANILSLYNIYIKYPQHCQIYHIRGNCKNICLLHTALHRMFSEEHFVFTITHTDT